MGLGSIAKPSLSLPGSRGALPSGFLSQVSDLWLSKNVVHPRHFDNLDDDHPQELGVVPFSDVVPHLFLPALFGPSSSCDHSYITCFWQYHHWTLLHPFSCRINDVVLTLRRPVDGWRATHQLKTPHQPVGSGMRGFTYYTTLFNRYFQRSSWLPHFPFGHWHVFFLVRAPLFLAQAAKPVVKTFGKLPTFGDGHQSVTLW